MWHNFYKLLIFSESCFEHAMIVGFSWSLAGMVLAALFFVLFCLQLGLSMCASPIARPFCLPCVASWLLILDACWCLRSQNKEDEFTRKRAPWYGPVPYFLLFLFFSFLSFSFRKYEKLKTRTWWCSSLFNVCWNGRNYNSQLSQRMDTSYIWPSSIHHLLKTLRMIL